jgi:type I restriction enzyme S subunit
LDAVKSKCKLIQTLRKEQESDFKKLVYKKYLELTENCEWILFKTVSPIVRRPFEPNSNEDYIEIGIKSFGNGTFQKPPVKGKQIAHKNLFKIKAGDLLFSNVFSWEGAIAIATEKDDICIGSHRFITSVPNKEKIQPEFLLYHLLSLKGNQDINKASPGTAGRNKTLGITKLENILVPLPATDNQNEFVELLHKINSIKKLRAVNEIELKALFPSILDKAFKAEW